MSFLFNKTYQAKKRMIQLLKQNPESGSESEAVYSDSFSSSSNNSDSEDQFSAWQRWARILASVESFCDVYRSDAIIDIALKPVAEFDRHLLQKILVDASESEYDETEVSEFIDQGIDGGSIVELLDTFCQILTIANSDIVDPESTGLMDTWTKSCVKLREIEKMRLEANSFCVYLLTLLSDETGNSSFNICRPTLSKDFIDTSYTYKCVDDTLSDNDNVYDFEESVDDEFSQDCHVCHEEIDENPGWRTVILDKKNSLPVKLNFCSYACFVKFDLY